jgi:dTMP kinase
MTRAGGVAGNGWLVTIEGPEGAGKTTQAQRLRDRAAAAGFDALLTREPGGTALGERIRELLLDPAQAAHTLDPRTDALLFNAARAQLCREVVRPALEAGRLVIATRFTDSTLAYQGFGGGVGLDELNDLARFATRGLTPDLTIVLDLPVEVGLGRKGADEVTRFEASFDLDFHRRVRDGFLELARREPDRIRVLDGTVPPDATAHSIASAVAQVPGLERLAPKTDGASGGGSPSTERTTPARPSEPAGLAGRIHP